MDPRLLTPVVLGLAAQHPFHLVPVEGLSGSSWAAEKAENRAQHLLIPEGAGGLRAGESLRKALES